MTIKQRDITGGLPRVQDLVEARVPKDKARISDIDGIVTIGGLKKTGRDIFVTPPNGLFAPNDGKVVVNLDEDKNQHIWVLNKKSVFAENDGKCVILNEGGKTKVQIAKRNQKAMVYEIPKSMTVIVKEGDSVKAGTPLCGKALHRSV